MLTKEKCDTQMDWLVEPEKYCYIPIPMRYMEVHWQTGVDHLLTLTDNDQLLVNVQVRMACLNSKLWSKWLIAFPDILSVECLFD